MIGFRAFLLLTIVRLGAVSSRQLEIIYAGKVARVTIFRNLKILLKKRQITKIYHPEKHCVAYCATPDAIRLIYGVDSNKFSQLKVNELPHILEVTETLIKLGRYPNIQGFATEHEMSPEDLEGFCFNRRPDAIVQVVRNNLRYEIAIEVECSIKNNKRLEQILSAYQQSFSRDLLCKAVMVVAKENPVYRSYSEKLKSKPKELTDRVLLVTPKNLNELNQNVFGVPSTKVLLRCDLIRTKLQNGTHYYSMNPEVYEISKHIKAHTQGDGSGNNI